MSTCRLFDNTIPFHDINIVLSLVTPNSFSLWCLELNHYRKEKWIFCAGPKSNLQSQAFSTTKFS